ncbi:MAG TPA: fumarylacetoacetase [Phycisphaerae bacterium]|nr:fumarylacetoacetase [Phycisphaerae bacterium]
MIFARNSTAKTWVEGAQDTEFPLQNLPYGAFRTDGAGARIGVAIGDYVLDLAALHRAGLFDGTPVAEENVFDRKQLNDFMGLGVETWRAVRRRIVGLLSPEPVTCVVGKQIVSPDKRLREQASLKERALIPREHVEMLMPCWIGAYVDFYSSKEHATNVGKMFRPDNPLLPNWVHIPIGYHGRASSVVVSGKSIRRPCGQSKADDAAGPSFGPCRLLDIELEMGFFTGPGNEMGAPISIDECPQRIFGMVLVNDWSARDIQKWEYQPLGPFLGKSFGTTVSPWVVPLDALAPFRVPQPRQVPEPLPYLQIGEDWGLDIALEIHLATRQQEAPVRIAKTNFRNMYWTIVQQLAHMASNGTNVEPGDLYASGTVSGPTPDSYGSLLELTWRGEKPLALPSGETRKFLADGDTVILRGACQAENFRIGFGECAGTILPALER